MSKKQAKNKPAPNMLRTSFSVAVIAGVSIFVLALSLVLLSSNL